MLNLLLLFFLLPYERNYFCQVKTAQAASFGDYMLFTQIRDPHSPQWDEMFLQNNTYAYKTFKKQVNDFTHACFLIQK